VKETKRTVSREGLDFWRKFNRVLLLFTSFLFLNTAWSMVEAIEEQKKDETASAGFQLSTWKQVLSFLSSPDIAKIKLTGNVPPLMSEAAVEICSRQRLCLTHRHLHASFFSGIKNGYCKKIQELDLSHSTFNPDSLKELPETLVELSINDVLACNGMTLDDKTLFLTKIFDALSQLRGLKKLNLSTHLMTDHVTDQLIEIARSFGIAMPDLRWNLLSDDETHDISEMHIPELYPSSEEEYTLESQFQ